MELRVDLTSGGAGGDLLAEAADPRTSAGRLVTLSVDPRMGVRRAAAANPSLPGDWLDLLRRAGSASDLSGAAPPDGTLPGEALREVAAAGPWGRVLAARHPATPVDVLADLAGDRSSEVRAAVAQHRAAPPAKLAELLTDGHRAVRSAAVRHPAAPQDLVARLTLAGGPPDAHEPGEPGPIEAAELADLASRGPWARRLAARHPMTPHDVLRTLAVDPEWSVRAEIARNPAADEHLLSQLATLDRDDVQVAIAGHPHAPAHVLATLSADARQPVRLAVAANPRTPAHALASLLEDGVLPVRQAAAANPSAPRDAIRRLVAAGSTPNLAGFATPSMQLSTADLTALAAGGPWAQQLAAHHPATPTAALEALACGENAMLREAVVRHPNRPVDLIDRLVRLGSDHDLQGFVEPQGGVDDATMAALIERGPWPRRLIARHAATSGVLLDQLSDDVNWQVRREVARHPATSEAALLRLATDAIADVRWNVVRRQHLPAEALRSLARDEHVAIRLAVLEHIDLPDDVRRQLQRDADADVRLAAATAG